MILVVYWIEIRVDVISLVCKVVLDEVELCISEDSLSEELVAIEVVLWVDDVLDIAEADEELLSVEESVEEADDVVECVDVRVLELELDEVVD